MAQHPTSIHCPASPPMQYLVRAPSPSPSASNTSQRPHPHPTLQNIFFFSPSQDKRNSNFGVFRLHTSNAAQVTSQCCSAALCPWKVSVVSSDTKNLSTGHLALLCSRHHGVTACIHLYRAVITQMDVCTGSSGAFPPLPVLQDAARSPATSRPDRHPPHCFAEGADRSIQAWKLIARMDTHSVGGAEKQVSVHGWDSFIALQRGKLSQQMATVLTNNCMWNSRENYVVVSWIVEDWSKRRVFDLRGFFLDELGAWIWRQPPATRGFFPPPKSATHRCEKSARLQFSAQIQSPLHFIRSVSFNVNLSLRVARYKAVSGALGTTTYWRFNPSERGSDTSLGLSWAVGF